MHCSPRTIKELEVFLTENRGKNFVKSHGKDTPRSVVCCASLFFFTDLSNSFEMNRCYLFLSAI
jgi:hypothetical protein